MEYGWIWIAVIVIAVIIEAFTDQLLSIWFVPAAIIATIMDYLEVGFVWQVLVFLLVSLIGIFVIRRFLGKIRPDSSSKTNIDAIVGEKCIVTETIDNFAGKGQVKVKGQVWSARSVDDDVSFEKGEVLKVVAIEGVKLICKKY